MECEICGKNEAECLIYIEGAQMNSCAGCARGGKIVYYFDAEGSITPLISQKARSEEEIVSGYGKLIKSAREKMRLSPEQLALKIAEKANYLEHVEKEISLPSLILARKLEKFLKIKLIEINTDAQPEIKPNRSKKEITLFDVAEIENKKKK